VGGRLSCVDTDEILGPHRVWRQLIAATPWGEQPHYLLRDRDRTYGAAFIPRAARIGIRTLLTPVRAPKANAIAERLVGTLRRECLDHLIVVNERHLRALLAEYAAHYNAARPHRALALDSPDGRPVVRLASGRIVGRPVLGGLHHEYEWVAA
jgi:transposase InsO family protein